MRNLLTDFDETLEAMALVEDRVGASWLTRQLASLENEDVDLTIHGALDHINRMKEAHRECLYTAEHKAEDEADAKWWLELAEDKMRYLFIVYGDGGWNRWGVRGNGEVMFSTMHSRGGEGKFSSDTEKAESLGFRTW